MLKKTKKMNIEQQATSYDRRATRLRNLLHNNPHLAHIKQFRQQCETLEQEGRRIADKILANEKKRILTPEQLKILAM